MAQTHDKSDVCSRRSKLVLVVRNVFSGISRACRLRYPTAATPRGHGHGRTSHPCMFFSPCSFKSRYTPSCWPCVKTSHEDGGHCRQFWKPAGFIRKRWLCTQPLPVSISVGWWAWCWVPSLRSVIEPIFPVGQSLAVCDYWNLNQPTFNYKKTKLKKKIQGLSLRALV